MNETETDDLTSGFQAFAMMFFGALLLIIGVVMLFVFWPIGLGFLFLGIVCIISGPLSAISAWW